ncbi:23S rRNA (uracil(1939)-C(5))-methyltransferase RlmD [Psychrobacillus sp. INOP01]|uniref:23S rRNA (uracil(1939)-C(5))-methyltransferase RlmD n=1 Tax=Psychrobacillus sp. INOP01 TaxID=2829187 RepID=UPI001BA93A6A|nr:23S rRNA (uracil(1939)-C(5))-methyltransferase RlmD [Psychrobacillus sp. INOP01]QUG42818.1 23S rRNA (uracil(1939)-C(5))-methyltransferase RlmD [Psychrobacillus sp. INOP01]
MSEKTVIEVGQEFPLTIKRLGINGEGVGFFKRNVVFVKGALPGEVVTAQVTVVNPKYAQAEIKTIREASPHRVNPPCPVYEACGGCQLQHMTYESQLLVKRDLVLQALERYVKDLASTIDVRPTIGMENPWHYRNKSQFQVRELGDKVIAGLYAEESNMLIDINDCSVQHPATTHITNEIKRFLKELNISIYDGRNSKGIVRTIVVRTGMKTGQIQVTLVTTQKKMPHKEELVQKIRAIDHNIVSISQNINAEDTSLVFGDTTFNLHGKETIHEKLGELAFDLSARAFFQLNPEQTVHLYNEIEKAAALTGEETIVDAYCGVGTIGLWLAKNAKEVRGMDIVEESIQDAKKNAKRNGFKNTKYVHGTAQHWLQKWKSEGFVPDVLTVDPPRAGLDDDLLKTILDIKPKRFVYTSCNPSTLAKDLAALKEVYNIKYIQPVDMFAQTAHVEAVTLLELK